MRQGPIPALYSNRQAAARERRGEGDEENAYEREREKGDVSVCKYRVYLCLANARTAQTKPRARVPKYKRLCQPAYRPVCACLRARACA